MRILRVSQHLYPDTKGGGQYHVHAMSRDQAAMGHDVTVLTTRTDPNLPEIEETDGYTVVREPEGISIAGNHISPDVGKYLWGAGSDEFDIIHAHSHLYFLTNLTALKRRLGDIPLAITNHGLYSQSAPKRVFSWYLQTLGRWTFNQADVVFCYTETDKKRVQELGVNSQIQVVSNGIDTERFTPDGPQSKRIESDGQVVLFVGRLVEGKRPGDAIRAVAELQEERPDVELYLCGDGPLRGDLEEVAVEFGIGDTVHFLGHVSYDEMPAVYRSCDALILPSRAEGFPRTVLEALASGIPVVSSYLEHTAHIVEEGGETVEVGDISGYVESLGRILDEREKLGKKGREIVANRFQWQETAKKTTETFERLL